MVAVLADYNTLQMYEVNSTMFELLVEIFEDNNILAASGSVQQLKYRQIASIPRGYPCMLLARVLEVEDRNY